MQTTTRAKLFLKHNTPAPLFALIRYVADRTLLKILPFFFQMKISDFKRAYFKEVICRDFRFQIEIEPSNGYLDAQIHARGLYEPHIVKIMEQHVHKGTACIDVGANIGHHTILMSHFVGDEGKVIAYEPIPRVRNQMSRSLAVNGIHNVNVRDVALSDAPGQLTLHVQKNNIGASSLVGGADTEQLLVHVTKLDEECVDKVDFMKIDVEGYEYHVLVGGEQLITRYRPTVIFEWSPLYYKIHDESHTRAILTFFSERNYELIDTEDNNKIITDFDTFISGFGNGLRSQTNILALPL